MRIGFLQFAPAWGDKQGNLERVAAGLRGCGADLVVLPELCTTGYQLTAAEARALAEPFPGGPSADALAGIARAERLHLVAGVAEQDGDGRVFNSAVLFGPDGHLGTYRKTHLFADEQDVFAPGDTGFRVFEAAGCKVGLMVCFDWLFPEAARSLALAGAQLLAHPSNLVLPWCQRAMPVRCLENGVFAVTANRTGAEARLAGRGELRFTGGSQVVDPRGGLLRAAGADEERLGLVEIDPGRALDKWITARNHALDDRRPELYRR